MVNAGADGFYRVAYSPELRARIQNRLSSLSGEERYATVSDAWADVLKGGAAAADYLTLVDELGDELRSLADWLGLEDIKVSRRGSFARHLADCVKGKGFA